MQNAKNSKNKQMARDIQVEDYVSNVCFTRDTHVTVEAKKMTIPRLPSRQKWSFSPIHVAS